MTDTEARERVWSCRIEGPAGPLAPGADFPMRIAVRKAYAEVTGASPTELSSGWTSVLTPADAPSDLRAAAQEVVRIGVLWSGKPDYDDAQAALIDAITALRAALSGDRPSPHHGDRPSPAECGCPCNCHGEGKPEWPGSCEACCNVEWGPLCECSRRLAAQLLKERTVGDRPSPEADPPRVVCTCGPWTVEGDPRFRTSKGTWHKRSCPFHLAPDDAPDCGIAGCPREQGHRGEHYDAPDHASPATAPAEGLDVDNDDFRDDHERAMRDHVIANFGISPQHICDDLCSDDIVSRLAARLAPDSAQEPR